MAKIVYEAEAFIRQVVVVKNKKEVIRKSKKILYTDDLDKIAIVKRVIKKFEKGDGPEKWDVEAVKKLQVLGLESGNPIFENKF